MTRPDQTRPDHNYYAYLSMWFRPRLTIRRVLEHNPYQGVRLLATILALENFFFYANSWSLGLRMNYLAVILVGVVVSPFWGAVWLWITSHIFYYTGRWLGGSAPIESLRTAMAWSKIPAVGILISWGCIIAIARDEAFIYAGGGSPYIMIFNSLNFVFALWSIFTLIQVIKELQDFSSGRSIANLLIAWTLFSGPFIATMYLILFTLNF